MSYAVPVRSPVVPLPSAGRTCSVLRTPWTVTLRRTTSGIASEQGSAPGRILVWHKVFDAAAVTQGWNAIDGLELAAGPESGAQA